MAAYADQMQRGWEDGEVVDVRAAMSQLTLKVVCRTLFGLEVDEQGTAAFFEAIEVLLHHAGEGTGFSMGLQGDLVGSARQENRRQMADTVSALDRFLYGLIERRRSEGAQGDDVLSVLLVARDEEGDGELMTDQEVRDELMALVFAGYETTANALTWAFNELAKHPEIADRIHSEIDQVLGGKLPTVGDVPRLAYTEKVWLETLRMYPPVPIGARRAREDVEVGGYIIPAGTPVVLCHYLTHRDPRWHQDPEQFNPERWTSEYRARLHKYAYFPFGGGARRCIGEPLAELEGRMILATIARNWRMEPIPGHQPDSEILVSLRPAGGLPLRVHRR
jgi:cytochrome P450